MDSSISQALPIASFLQTNPTDARLYTDLLCNMDPTSDLMNMYVEKPEVRTEGSSQAGSRGSALATSGHYMPLVSPLGQGLTHDGTIAAEVATQMGIAPGVQHTQFYTPQ